MKCEEQTDVEKTPVSTINHYVHLDAKFILIWRAFQLSVQPYAYSVFFGKITPNLGIV